MRHLFFLAALAATPAMAQITIENAWTRATPPGAKIAAGYMVIHNAGTAPDRLIGVSSPAAEKVEMHVTAKDGDVLRMREVKGYDIPAKASYELKLGGSHLMFVNIKAPFKEGDKIPATLKFEKAGELKSQLDVRPLAGGAMQHKGH